MRGPVGSVTKRGMMGDFLPQFKDGNLPTSNVPDVDVDTTEDARTNNAENHNTEQADGDSPHEIGGTNEVISPTLN